MYKPWSMTEDLPPRRDKHVYGLIDEQLGCSEANSAIPACDYRYFSFQCAHTHPLLSGFPLSKLLRLHNAMDGRGLHPIQEGQIQ